MADVGHLSEEMVGPGDILLNGRSIYECANQLHGYVDMGTPDDLAAFLLREGGAAAALADEIVKLRAALNAQPRL